MIANCEMATIQGFTDDGRMNLKMDVGRASRLTRVSIRTWTTALP